MREKTVMNTTRREFLERAGAAAAAIGMRPVVAVPGLPGRGVAAQDDVVHLNYNESPYGPSPKALEAIRKSESALYGRYFGDDSYETLSKALAAHHDVKRENVQVAAGSTEILKICDDVFLGPKPRVVVAEPAYEAVIQYAVNSKAIPLKVALTSDFRHDLPAMAEATTADTGLAYICNPNNPTGTIVRRDEVRRFMDRVPESVTVVVDEAYADFVTDPEYESAARYVREGRNVIVARTFSKIHGLAGMRVGYALARPDLIARIKPFTVDYALTGVAANAALASLGDRQHLTRVARANAAQRTTFVAEMRRAGFQCAEPHGNFGMVDIRRPVAAVIPEFGKRRVLVGREFPAMPTFLRVTMGTESEMKRFYSAFREVVRGSTY
jgi:histidinol-phosphate aminotransferase